MLIFGIFFLYFVNCYGIEHESAYDTFPAAYANSKSSQQQNLCGAIATVSVLYEKQTKSNCLWSVW